MQTFGLHKRGAFRALTIAALLSACTHAPTGPKVDRASGLDLAPIAARFRFHIPKCQVSVPLSQEEALYWVERSGVPDPESRKDWIEMVAATEAGDQLRQVSCLTKGSSGMAAGDVFLGLFRDGVMVAEMHYIIIN